MTVSNEDIFAAFDLSGDILSDVLTDEVGFINKNRTAVRRDVPSQFVGTLAGHEFPSEVTFREGKLTSLTLIRRQREDGRFVYTARGAMSNVKLDISIKEGNEKIDLIDKMVELTNASIAKSGKVYTRQEFLQNISNKNMRFAAISPETASNYRGMSLFFEQQGTSEEQFELAAKNFVDLGAVPVSTSTRVVSQYRHTEGVPVLGFEMNRQDRTLNRAGTGFLDLVDASISSLLNYFKFAGLLKATDRQITSASGKELESLKQRREMITKEINNFTRSLGNWGGVQPGVMIQPDGSVTNNGEWYTTNIPCGRVQLANGDDSVELDFWSTRADKPAGASVIDTTSGTVIADGEDPF